MRVLITGATGLIGQRLVRHLAQSGHEAWALSRRPEHARRQVSELGQAYRWDIKEPPPLEAFAGVEGVVSLAGERIAGRWTPRKRRAIQASRVAGTASLVAGLARLQPKPRVLVAMSAVGYYGDRAEEELTEASAPGGGFLADVCREWEQQATSAEAIGMRVVRLRMAPVLSISGGMLGALMLPYRLGLGGPIGSGLQWWPWVHLEDALNAVRWSLENEVAGPFNLTAPGLVRQREFASALGRVMRRPAFFPLPGFAARLALGGFADELLFSRKVNPNRTEAAGYRFAHPNLESALRDVLGR